MKQADADYFDSIIDTHPVDVQATFDYTPPAGNQATALPQPVSSMSDEDSKYFDNLLEKQPPVLPTPDQIYKGAPNDYSSVIPDFMLNLGKGAVETAKIAPEVASYLSDPAKRNASSFVFYNPEHLSEPTRLQAAIQSGTASEIQGMSGLEQALENAKSDWSRSAQQNQPMFTKSANPNDILPFNYNSPSVSQLSNIGGSLLPQLGLFELGGGLGDVAKAAGASDLVAGASKALGYGLGNAAVTAPQSYQSTYDQSYANGINSGMSPDDADKAARQAADQVMNVVAPLAVGVGAAGGKLASGVTGNAASRFIKGSAIGSLPMGAQMGGQYLAEQSALNQPVNPYAVASQVGTGMMMAAPMEGSVGVREGTRNAPGKNTTAMPELPATGINENGKIINQTAVPYNAETGRYNQADEAIPAVGVNTHNEAINIANTPENGAIPAELPEQNAPVANTETPVNEANTPQNAPADIGNTNVAPGESVPSNTENPSLSPVTDIDTATTTLNAIKSGDVDNIHPDVLSDLTKSGDVQIDQNGQPALTDFGNRLLDAINQSREPQKEFTIPQAQEIKTPAENAPQTVAEQQTTKPTVAFEPAPVGKPTDEVLQNRLVALEQEHDALPDNSPLRDGIKKEMNAIVERLPSTQQARENGTLNTPKILPKSDLNVRESTMTPEDKQALIDYHYENDEDIPFSVTPKETDQNVTPTDKFLAQKDNIKDKVTNIIKRMNPDVDVKLLDKMFGEGEAIKASGGTSTARQEVGGSFNRLANLVKVSMNMDKFDPLDTAYHEGYHAARHMVSAADDTILKKAFPGTDKLSQEEHEAVEFGKFMTKKNAPGLSPAVGRIFSSIRQALRDIGRTLKVGKFNSVEDIFNRAERGSVYDDYQRALRNGDIDHLKSSTLPPDQQKEAIAEVSPKLHDIVYKTMSDKDEEALRNVNTESNGSPIDKVAKIANDAYNKTMDVAQDAKEKLLRSSMDVVAPIIGKEAADNARKSVERSIANTKRVQGGENIPTTINNVRHIVASSADGFGRAIAAKFNSLTTRGVMDIFHPDPGRDRSIRATYHEFIQDYYNKTMSRVATVLKNTETQSDKDAIRNYMTNPGTVTAEAIKNDPNAAIASHLSQEIERMRDMLMQHGYEVPELNGFYPRIYDTDYIIKNEMAFKKAAAVSYARTYKDDLPNLYNKSPDKDSLSQEQFTKNYVNDRVNAWYNNILLQDDGMIRDVNKYFQNVSTTPEAPSSFKQRILDKESDETLKDFMVKDPLTAMNKLTMQTARKAAWERDFGGGKLQAIHDGLIADGLDATAQGHVWDIVAANTGQLGGDISPSFKNALGLARFVSAATFLIKAPYKHLSIAMNVGAQTGDMMNAYHTLVDTTHAFVGKGDKARAMATIGQLNGVWGEGADHAMLMNQMGTETNNQKLQFLNKQFYNAIGMTRLIGSFKLGMMRSIQYYIGNMADDIVNHKNSYNSSQFMMRNYGVPADEVENLSRWIMEGGGKNINAMQILDNSPHSQMYQLMMQRAVNQMISNPTPAMRQIYATHPVAGLVYQMSAYSMGFLKQSIERNARLASNAFAPGNTIKDSLRFLTPALLTMTTSIAFSMAFQAAKNAVFPPDKEDQNSPIAEGIVNSDFLGPYNGLTKALAGNQSAQDKFGYKYKTYGGNFDALGPVASEGKKLWNTAFNVANNFGNQKGKATELKNEYSLIAAPLLTAAISTYNPFPILGWAAIQAINSPQVRRAVTGQKKE